MPEIHIISTKEKLMQKCNKELSGGETCHSYFLLIGCILLKCIVAGGGSYGMDNFGQILKMITDMACIYITKD